MLVKTVPASEKSDRSPTFCTVFDAGLSSGKIASVDFMMPHAIRVSFMADLTFKLVNVGA